MHRAAVSADDADLGPASRREGVECDTRRVTGFLPWGAASLLLGLSIGDGAWGSTRVWQRVLPLVCRQRSQSDPDVRSLGPLRCLGAPGAPAIASFRLCSERPTGGCAIARTAGAAVALPRIPPRDGL